MINRKALKEKIEASLRVLIGLPLWNITRTSTLFSFDFGTNFISVKTRHGSTKLISDYALDTECEWHIAGLEGIVVASGDRVYPAGPNPYENLLEFEWDQKDAKNRCDERMRVFLDAHEASPLIVGAINASYSGGLSISFSGDYILEIFPNVSVDIEYWRLFQPTNETMKHFVVTAHGIK